MLTDDRKTDGFSSQRSAEFSNLGVHLTPITFGNNPEAALNAIDKVPSYSQQLGFEFTSALRERSPRELAWHNLCGMCHVY